MLNDPNLKNQEKRKLLNLLLTICVSKIKVNGIYTIKCHYQCPISVLFAEADYRLSYWNNLVPKIEERSDDCYTSTYPIDSVLSLKYVDITK